MKQAILNILETIAEDINGKSKTQCFSYVQQRQMIGSLFGKYDQVDYGMAKVMLRLTVIDSLYSTNAAYSYFSIEEMAEKILTLGSERKAADYFYEIATGSVDGKILFNEFYGIKKNLAHGSKQISLLSKYAYYLLMQDPQCYPLGFPIYDSLAIESYPKVCKKIGLSERSKIGSNIKNYISAINELREKIFNNNELWYGLQQFDILDAYLWRLGKFENGNLSLLIERKDYETFITSLGLNHYKSTKYEEKEGSFKFNDSVRKRCIELQSKSLKGINNEYFKKMMIHWLEHYSICVY